MNTGNAFGFVGLGISMWLLPFIAPSWFPQVAVDGSSTRALWVQVMGVLQFGIGAAYVARHAYFTLQGGVQEVLAKVGPQRGAIATADWTTDGWPDNVITVNFASPVAAAAGGDMAAHGRLTPHGRRTALWRMLEKAWATEERLSEFITRTGRRHLALHAGGLAAYLKRVSSPPERLDPLGAIYDLLTEDLRRQQGGVRDAA